MRVYIAQFFATQLGRLNWYTSIKRQEELGVIMSVSPVTLITTFAIKLYMLISRSSTHLSGRAKVTELESANFLLLSHRRNVPIFKNLIYIIYPCLGHLSIFQGYHQQPKLNYRNTIFSKSSSFASHASPFITPCT